MGSWTESREGHGCVVMAFKLDNQSSKFPNVQLQVENGGQWMAGEGGVWLSQDNEGIQYDCFYYPCYFSFLWILLILAGFRLFFKMAIDV